MPNKAKKIKGVYAWAVVERDGEISQHNSKGDTPLAIYETERMAEYRKENWEKKIKVKITPCK